MRSLTAIASAITNNPWCCASGASVWAVGPYELLMIANDDSQRYTDAGDHRGCVANLEVRNMLREPNQLYLCREHPASRVDELMLQCRKALFADKPLRSALHGPAP